MTKKKTYLKKTKSIWNKIKKLRGIAKGQYDEFGGGANYIRKERDEWDK